MIEISGLVRRAAAVTALLAALPLAGCAEEGTTGTAPSTSPGTEGSPSGPGPRADGQCGGGEVETRVVEAADGVELTVPATWRTPTNGGPDQIALLPPKRDVGDGFLLVGEGDQTLDEAVAEVERLNSFAEKTSDEVIELDGFAEARLLTYADDDEEAFTVNVVAVDDGVRVVANMARKDLTEQPLTESCLSTLARTG